MSIENSKLIDIDNILNLYSSATNYMKSKNQVHWPEFPNDLILNEIEENRQWKLLIEDKIACIWATTLNDELIWGDKNKEPSLYIHRIATNPVLESKTWLKN
ncbi:hypothetical protein [Maribacter aestuarii]|uniref:hypothetical protein n=1 Tax=Maribacter aestuarii TaxID=1130723 RepID=UPI00248B5894|nr:hypothetical protein [Maribacter aestuarii]